MLKKLFIYSFFQFLFIFSSDIHFNYTTNNEVEITYKNNQNYEESRVIDFNKDEKVRVEIKDLNNTIVFNVNKKNASIASIYLTAATKIRTNRFLDILKQDIQLRANLELNAEQGITNRANILTYYDLNFASTYGNFFTENCRIDSAGKLSFDFKNGNWLNINSFIVADNKIKIEARNFKLDYRSDEGNNPYIVSLNDNVEITAKDIENYEGVILGQDVIFDINGQKYSFNKKRKNIPGVINKGFIGANESFLPSGNENSEFINKINNQNKNKKYNKKEAIDLTPDVDDEYSFLTLFEENSGQYLYSYLNDVNQYNISKNLAAYHKSQENFLDLEKIKFVTSPSIYAQIASQAILEKTGKPLLPQYKNTIEQFYGLLNTGYNWGILFGQLEKLKYINPENFELTEEGKQYVNYLIENFKKQNVENLDNNFVKALIKSLNQGQLDVAPSEEITFENVAKKFISTCNNSHLVSLNQDQINNSSYSFIYIEPILINGEWHLTLKLHLANNPDFGSEIRAKNIKSEGFKNFVNQSKMKSEKQIFIKAKNITHTGSLIAGKEGIHLDGENGVQLKTTDEKNSATCETQGNLIVESKNGEFISEGVLYEVNGNFFVKSKNNKCIPVVKTVNVGKQAYQYLIQNKFNVKGQVVFVSENNNVFEAVIINGSKLIYLEAKNGKNVVKGKEITAVNENSEWEFQASCFLIETLKMLATDSDLKTKMWQLVELDPILKNAIGFKDCNDWQDALAQGTQTGIELLRVFYNYANKSDNNLVKTAFIFQRLGLMDLAGNFVPGITFTLTHTKSNQTIKNTVPSIVNAGQLVAISQDDTEIIETLFNINKAYVESKAGKVIINDEIKQTADSKEVSNSISASANLFGLASIGIGHSESEYYSERYDNLNSHIRNLITKSAEGTEIREGIAQEHITDDQITYIEKSKDIEESESNSFNMQAGPGNIGLNVVQQKQKLVDNKVVYQKSLNIGIAISKDDVVPVIAQVDYKKNNKHYRGVLPGVNINKAKQTYETIKDLFANPTLEKSDTVINFIKEIKEAQKSTENQIDDFQDNNNIGFEENNLIFTEKASDNNDCVFNNIVVNDFEITGETAERLLKSDNLFKTLNEASFELVASDHLALSTDILRTVYKKDNDTILIFNIDLKNYKIACSICRQYKLISTGIDDVASKIESIHKEFIQEHERNAYSGPVLDSYIYNLTNDPNDLQLKEKSPYANFISFKDIESEDYKRKCLNYVPGLGETKNLCEWITGESYLSHRKLTLDEINESRNNLLLSLATHCVFVGSGKIIGFINKSLNKEIVKDLLIAEAQAGEKYLINNVVKECVENNVVNNVEKEVIKDVVPSLIYDTKVVANSIAKTLKGTVKEAKGSGWIIKIPYKNKKNIIVRIMDVGSGQRSKPYFRVSIPDKPCLTLEGKFSNCPIKTHIDLTPNYLEQINNMINKYLGK